MKARPYKVVDEVYVQCDPSEATHVGLRLPGPLEFRILPVKVKTEEQVKAEQKEFDRKSEERKKKIEEKREERRKQREEKQAQGVMDRMWESWTNWMDNDWLDGDDWYDDWYYESYARYDKDWQSWRDGSWTWNGDMESPSLVPSIVTKVGKHVCHSWITDGKVKFFGDCTHEFKDQTLDLLELEELN